eukprot:175941-Hanusia_phi.AAC.1
MACGGDGILARAVNGYIVYTNLAPAPVYTLDDHFQPRLHSLTFPASEIAAILTPRPPGGRDQALLAPLLAVIVIVVVIVIVIVIVIVVATAAAGGRDDET